MLVLWPQAHRGNKKENEFSKKRILGKKKRLEISKKGGILIMPQGVAYPYQQGGNDNIFGFL